MVFAFAIANTGSYRINQSQVLPNLEIALLEKALKQTRTTNHSRVGAWLLTQFQIEKPCSNAEIQETGFLQ